MPVVSSANMNFLRIRRDTFRSFEPMEVSPFLRELMETGTTDSDPMSHMEAPQSQPTLQRNITTGTFQGVNGRSLSAIQRRRPRRNPIPVSPHIILSNICTAVSSPSRQVCLPRSRSFDLGSLTHVPIAECGQQKCEASNEVHRTGLGAALVDAHSCLVCHSDDALRWSKAGQQLLKSWEQVALTELQCPVCIKDQETEGHEPSDATNPKELCNRKLLKDPVTLSCGHSVCRTHLLDDSETAVVERYEVTSMYGICIRSQPDVASQRLYTVGYRETFLVSEVLIPAPANENGTQITRKYLRLADGSGWAFDLGTVGVDEEQAIVRCLGRVDTKDYTCPKCGSKGKHATRPPVTICLKDCTDLVLESLAAAAKPVFQLPAAANSAQVPVSRRHSRRAQTEHLSGVATEMANLDLGRQLEQGALMLGCESFEHLAKQRGLLCPVCLGAYDDRYTLPVVLVGCGHTLCRACCNRIVVKRCPVCTIDFALHQEVTSPALKALFRWWRMLGKRKLGSMDSLQEQLAEWTNERRERLQNDLFEAIGCRHANSDTLLNQLRFAWARNEWLTRATPDLSEMSRALAAGANPSALHSSGLAPLHLVAAMSSPPRGGGRICTEVVLAAAQLLLNAGARADQVSHIASEQQGLEGASRPVVPAVLAAESGACELVETLIDSWSSWPIVGGCKASNEEGLALRRAVVNACLCPVKKLHHHPLARGPRRMHRCDIRGVHCSRMGTVWRCTAGCEFDVCEACYEKESRTTVPDVNVHGWRRVLKKLQVPEAAIATARLQNIAETITGRDVSEQDLGQIRDVLAAGADPNGDGGQTRAAPLHLVSLCLVDKDDTKRHVLSILSLLLDARADTTREDSQGWCPALAALLCQDPAANSFEVVEKLLSNPCQKDTPPLAIEPVQDELVKWWELRIVRKGGRQLSSEDIDLGKRFVECLSGAPPDLSATMARRCITVTLQGTCDSGRALLCLEFELLKLSLLHGLDASQCLDTKIDIHQRSTHHDRVHHADQWCPVSLRPVVLVALGGWQDLSEEADLAPSIAAMEVLMAAQKTAPSEGWELECDHERGVNKPDFLVAAEYGARAEFVSWLHERCPAELKQMWLCEASLLFEKRFYTDCLRSSMMKSCDISETVVSTAYARSTHLQDRLWAQMANLSAECVATADLCKHLMGLKPSPEQSLSVEASMPRIHSPVGSQRPTEGAQSSRDEDLNTRTDDPTSASGTAYTLDTDVPTSTRESERDSEDSGPVCCKPALMPAFVEECLTRGADPQTKWRVEYLPKHLNGDGCKACIGLEPCKGFTTPLNLTILRSAHRSVSVEDSLSVIRILVDAKADPMLADGDSRTPLELASHHHSMRPAVWLDLFRRAQTPETDFTLRNNTTLPMALLHCWQESRGGPSEVLWVDCLAACDPTAAVILQREDVAALVGSRVKVSRPRRPPPPKRKMVQVWEHCVGKDEAAFQIGSRVRCREHGGEWMSGVVTLTSPLEVMPDDWNQSYQWSEVEAEHSVLFLPKQLRGITVLKPQVVGPFQVDTSELKAITGRSGVAYRKSKKLEDLSHVTIGHGETISGVDEGDGWIKVDMTEAPEKAVRQVMQECLRSPFSYLFSRSPCASGSISTSATRACSWHITRRSL